MLHEFSNLCGIALSKGEHGIESGTSRPGRLCQTSFTAVHPSDIELGAISTWFAENAPCTRSTYIIQAKDVDEHMPEKLSYDSRRPLLRQN